METTSHQNRDIKIIPGIVIVLMQWLLRFVLPVLSPDSILIGIAGSLLCFIALLVWWFFYSKAHVADKWIALAAIITALAITPVFLHESVATGGQGMMFYIFVFPPVSLSLVLWAILFQHFQAIQKRILLILCIFISAGIFTLLRSDGITGNFSVVWKWRWSETYEQKYLTKASLTKETQKLHTAQLTEEPEWSGFRGNNRNSTIESLIIEPDWEKHPPVELWRMKIGPACSSVAIQGEYLITQEQRGDNEMVNCYNLLTGETVWEHADEARFWDSHAGAGPRSTPTLFNNKVITLGATGLLNVLNLSDGSLVWHRDAAKETGAEIPGWGYCGSPLLIDSTIIISLSGTIAAYDYINGELLWKSENGGESYSSPHEIDINDEKQVLFTNKSSAIAYDPKTGTERWRTDITGVSIIQPMQINPNEIIIAEGDKKGMRRIKVTPNNDRFDIVSIWKTNKLRPDFNDFVVHNGFIYGIEGQSVICIDINDGTRKWKSGRYGGQLILLSKQSLLLLLSEKGDLVLVSASPDQLNELGRIKAIEGKTWNHHAISKNVLIARNANEMAAYKLQ